MAELKAGDWVVSKRGQVAHKVSDAWNDSFYGWRWRCGGMERGMAFSCGRPWLYERELRPATDADPRCAKCLRMAR